MPATSVRRSKSSARRRELRTSWWSTRRAPGSPARRCGVRALSARHEWCTSRATRRPSPPTSRCCATSTATSSIAAVPWTCSRTHPTWSRCRRSALLDRARAHPPDLAPEQVRIRQEEAETHGRERGKACDAVPRPDEHDGRREEGGHPDPRRRDSQAEAGRRGEEEGKEDHVGGAEVHGCRLAGSGKRDRDPLEDPGPLLDDVLRRAGRDRPDVDPRYEDRDERQPPELLEEREEAEADEGEACELGDVRGRLGVEQRESEG